MDPVIAPSLLILLGLFAPSVVAIVKSDKFPSWVNQTIAIIVCFGAAILNLVLLNKFNDLSFELLVGYAATVFVVANSFYSLYFKDTAWNKKLEKAIWG